MSDAAREAVRDAEMRYRIEGTSDHPSGYGPPYRSPWFLIDTATAEPEVNWPGGLVAECEDVEEAKTLRCQLIADAAIQAYEEERAA